MRRLFMLVCCALVLLTQTTAFALSMEVLETSVFVDVYARAETSVRDRPARTAAVLTLDTAVAVFVRQGSSASADSNAQSARIPFLSRPERLETSVDLDVEAKTKSSLEAESASSGGGLVRLQVLGQAGVDPAAALTFDILLDSLGVGSANWNASYLVFNETLGTTIFSFHASNTGGSIPGSFATPVTYGDTIRIEWSSDLSVLAADGATASGSLHFNSGFGPVVVPEPGSTLLMLGGLLVMCRTQRPTLRRH